MGIVYRPEDLRKKIEKKREDLSPGVKPQTSALSLEALMVEVRNLKVEIEKIKKALIAHGIKVE